MKFAKTASLYIFYLLMAYMPLHILLSTWLGTSLGMLELAKIAKEFVMLLGAGLGLAAWIKPGQLKNRLKVLLSNRLIQLISVFVGLNIVLVLLKSTDADAELLGLAYNTRFLIFFVWAVLLAQMFDTKKLIHVGVKVVLTSGALVVLFGLVQYTLLPNDALTHIGYSRTNGVLPVFFIDDKPDLERIMSTLRDPNSLGSYLLIITALCASIAIAAKNTKQRYQLAIYGVLAILAIFWTFSRSALIGSIAALAVVVYFAVQSRTKALAKYKRPLVLGLFVFIVMLGLFISVFKDSYIVQNVVFHADESTVLETPNQKRFRYWGESIDAIVKHPIGGGPGTAGLASIKNDEQTVLNENYYLQTGYELGILGLVLFLAILLMAGVKLHNIAKEQRPVAIALLASFIGLAITNFFVHIWANEAVAYTWWGLAGMVMSTRLLKSTKS